MSVAMRAAAAGRAVPGLPATFWAAGQPWRAVAGQVI
jgi:hypothetical protein